MFKNLENININCSCVNLKFPRKVRNLIGLSSLLSLGLIFRDEIKKQLSENLIAFKKERLSMPVYEMSDEDMINPPWANGNLDKWLYRLVKFNARETHSREFLIPKKHEYYAGYDMIVPFVIKETDDLLERKGVLVRLGWMQHEYKHSTTRVLVQPNVETKREVIGYVSDCEDLQNKNLFRKGNAYDEQRWIWNHYYLPDIAKASGLLNVNENKFAVIEEVDLNTTKLDERDTRHYAVDMKGSLKVPYTKTLAGALQNNKMPWDYKEHQLYYMGYSLLSMSLFLLSKAI